MTRNKAVRILLNQTKKPLEDNFDFELWIHESRALIERFFGKDSEQYKRLINPGLGDHSCAEIRIKPNKHRQILLICAILKCCSDTIRINGIYKKRKILLYFALPAIAILLFGAVCLFYMERKPLETKTVIQSKPLLIHTVSKSINKIPVTNELSISHKS